MINGLSWLNLGNGNIQTRETILSNDYNDLTNKPIIILSGTIQNPIKLWTLETGAYILNGYVQHTIELASEAKGLFTTVTAMLIDGKYTISAYVPFWEGLYEYILPSSTSATYSEHQVIDIVSQEDTLILSNEEIYNPTKDYHPSTKKYADDMLSALRNELANMGVNETDINKLKVENRRKDIIIQALLSQNSDKTVTIDEEVHNISMDLSIDKGMATINKLEGSTLVNVSKQKEETPLSCKVDTVEKINTVELTQDGVIKPTLQGNTLVNNNAQWNDVVEIGTEIEPLIGTEVEIVDTMGEVDVALEGHTAINVSNRKGGLLATDFADVQSGNYIELNPSEDCGTTLEVEGSTLVNVCDQKESIAITKSYTVENTNHVPLQGEYDGKCRPVVEGNTLVNLTQHTGLDLYSFSGSPTFTFTIEGNFCKYSSTVESNAGYITIDSGSHKLLKPNTTYTIIYTVKSNSGLSVGGICVRGANDPFYSESSANTIYVDKKDGYLAVGKHMLVVQTPDDISLFTGFGMGFPSLHMINYPFEFVIGEFMIFEGDLTANPPSGYIEGLKSSFEDGYIPENLFDEKLELGNMDTSNNPGALIESSDAVRTVNYIEVKPNTQYTLLNDKNYHYNAYYYDSNYVCIGYIENVTIITPDNCRYLKFRSWTGSVENDLSVKFIFLEGDWTQNPPTYEEVMEHSGKYKVEYKVTGKNKFNKNKEFKLINSNFKEKNSNLIINNDYIQITYGLYGDANYLGTIGSFKKGTYTISCELYLEDCGSKQINIGYFINNDNLKDKYSLYVSNYNSWEKFQYTFTLEEDTDYLYLQFQASGSSNKYLGLDFRVRNIQLEEGTVATEYEPYKSYTKTFYLSSPLLEGDTIEDVNGKATHVHRYGKVVLNGSEGWNLNNNSIGETLTSFYTPCNGKSDGIVFCDIWSSDGNITTHELVKIGRYNSSIYMSILNSRLSTVDINGFKQWLSENPTTVVYELATPTYETISEESILCDSYVNGHLDLDTNIPISKVEFKHHPERVLRYIQSSTNYIIQFNSDNEGYLDFIQLGGSSYARIKNCSVHKGINRFSIASYSNTKYSVIEFRGIGFNASNIQVVATDKEFDYFEGLSSSYESERIPSEENSLIQKGTNHYYNEKIIHSISLNVINIKPLTTYTVIFKDDTGKLNSTQICAGTGSPMWKSLSNDKIYKFTTPENVNVDVRIYMYSDANWSATPKNPFTNGDENKINILLLEGDYTNNPPTYEEVMNYGGKYKVKYNVVGKNLVDEKWEAGSINDKGTPFDTAKRIRSTSHIKVKPNTSYTRTSHEIYVITYDKDKKFLERLYYSGLERTFVTPFNVEYIKLVVINTDDLKLKYQLEEGTTATSYEPYRTPYTKTLYLNSPLLEGDKIVTYKGNICHWHKMGSIVLDGSEEWTRLIDSNNKKWYRLDKLELKLKTGELNSMATKLICDKFQSVAQKNIALYANTISAYEYIVCYTAQAQDDNFTQWLQNNPTTVVYELANPYYEIIEPSNDTSVELFSTVSHISTDTAIPINSASFKPYEDELAYLEANTQYRLAFDCDVEGININISLGGTEMEYITKLNNSILITTPSEIVDTKLVINAKGIVNIDNVRITKGDMVYPYFEGMKSSFEEERNLIRIEDNLFCEENIVELTKTNNVVCTYNNGTLAFGRADGYTGMITSSNMFRLQGLTPGVKYALTFDIDNLIGLGIRFDKDGNNWDTLSETIVANKGFNKIEFTMANDYIYFGLRCVTNPNNVGKFIFNNIAISEIDKCTDDGKYNTETTINYCPIEFGKGGRIK